MDFVSKQVLDAQLKKVSKPFKTSSDSGIEPTWVAFTNRSPAKPQDNDAESKSFHDTECPPNASPKNFPPLLLLCYMGKSIRSEVALVPVTWASRMFFSFIVLLFFNTTVVLLFMIFDKGYRWLRFLISVIANLQLSVYQLILYETASKGTYRTSLNLRKRYRLYIPYSLFSVMNVPLLFLCSFLGVKFLRGWIRTRKDGTGVKEMNLSLRRLLVILQLLGWTALFFVNTYTLYQYYHLEVNLRGYLQLHWKQP